MCERVRESVREKLSLVEMVASNGLMMGPRRGGSYIDAGAPELLGCRCVSFKWSSN